MVLSNYLPSLVLELIFYRYKLFKLIKYKKVWGSNGPVVLCSPILLLFIYIGKYTRI